MDQTVAGARGSTDGVIKIVSHTHHPGSVPSSRQICSWSAATGVPGAGGPDGPRTVRPGGVHPSKTLDSERRNDTLRKGGTHRDIAQRRGRKRPQDLGAAALNVGPAYQHPV